MDISIVEKRLGEAVGEWEELLHDPGSGQEKLDSVYRGKILPLVVELFKQKEGKKIGEVYGLILTVGNSPEPLILSVSACQPARALFLFTEDTEHYLDDIIDMTGLRPSQWDKRPVKENDPLTIYKEVFDAWTRWGKRGDVAVDITGGTKSMTSGLAMAGAILGLQLLYIANEVFLKELRKPKPGTEYLELLPNPYTVFGHLKENEAVELFNRCDFHGAAKVFEELTKRVPDPRKYFIYLSIAKGYETWDSLNIQESSSHLFEAAEQIKKNPLEFSIPTDSNVLEEQATMLEHLATLMPGKPKDSTLSLLQNRKAVETLVFTLYFNAMKRDRQGKWDAASLFLYRLLEVFEQRTFAKYGIDTANPDYSRINNYSEYDILKSFNDIRAKWKRETLEELPNPIGLDDAYMILEAIEEPFNLNNSNIHRGNFLNEIKKRNYSILAHGFIFVSQEQFTEFKEMVDDLLNLFCNVEDFDIKKNMEQFSSIFSQL